MADKSLHGSKTLFVRNLPYSTTNESLEEAFQEYGPIKSCFVVKDGSTNKSKGFGYVIFSVREDSEKAQKGVQKIGNRKVQVCFAKPKETKKDRKKPVDESKTEPKDDAEEDEDETKASSPEKTDTSPKGKKGREASSNVPFTLVVTGFNAKDKKAISRLTSGCENVVDTTYPAPDRETPTALIKFNTKIDAIKALNKINKQRTKEHPIKAIFSYQEGRTPKQVSPKLCKLIVRNISFSCTENDLQEAFAKFGTITEVKIPVKPDGKMFGYGFVQFSSLVEAKEAMTQMNAKPIKGRPVAVDWALAREKYQEAMGKKPPTSKEDDTSPKDEKVEKKNKDTKKPTQKKQASKKQSTDSEEDGESSEEEDESSEEEDKSSEAENESSEEENESGEAENESSEEEEESEEEVEGSSGKRLKNEGSEEESDMESDGSDKESDDESDMDRDESDMDSDESDMDSDEDDEGFSDGSSGDEKKTKKPKKQAPRPDDVGEGKTLFIRNVSFDSEEEDLEELLSQYGEIKYCRLVIDKQTEHSKGVAFVQFVNKEDADKCLLMSDNEQLQQGGIVLDGRKLRISLAVSRDEAAKLKTKPDKEDEKKDKRNLWLLREGLIRPGTQAAKGLSKEDLHKREQVERLKRQKLKNPDIFVSPTRLCVRNIPTSVSDHQLMKVFQKAAADKSAVVKESRIMRDMKRVNAAGRGKPRGYGFIEFEDHKHALAALRETNNNPDLFGEKKRLIVEFSLESRSALRTKQERLERAKAKQEMLNRNQGQKPNKQMRGKKKITVGQVQAPPKGVDTKKIPRGMPSHMGPKIRHKPRAPAPKPKKPKDAVSRKVAQTNKAKRKAENTIKEPSAKKRKGGQMRTDDIDRLVAKYRTTFKQAAVKKQSQKWFET